jgi:hypothetical protein
LRLFHRSKFWRVVVNAGWRLRQPYYTVLPEKQLRVLEARGGVIQLVPFNRPQAEARVFHPGALLLAMRGLAGRGLNEVSEEELMRVYRFFHKLFS